jgi:hypothetical protein
MRNTATDSDDEAYLTDLCVQNGTALTVLEKATTESGTEFLLVRAFRMRGTGWVKSLYVKLDVAIVPAASDEQSDGAQPRSVSANSRTLPLSRAIGDGHA